MKTAIISLFSLLLTLTMIVPTTIPVLAADDQSTATTPGRQSLMIKAPNVTEVGQPVTITIFSKPQHKPVARAAVYALKINQLPVTSNKSNFDTIISGYTTLGKEKGIFLGNTGEDGNVNYKFTDSNRYILLAIKDGYFPGFSRISITLSAKKGLNIKAPNGTEVGKPVTIVVTERFTNVPVANAAVYAKFIREINVPTVLPIPPPVKVVPPPSTSNAAPPSISPNTPGTTMITTDKPTETPRPTITTTISSIAPLIKANTTDFEGDRKTAEAVQQGGFLLGNTNGKGELVSTFKDDGAYMLAAIKENYAPGLAKIGVTLAQQKKLGIKALDIKAPSSSPTGQAVTITVFDRQIQNVVEKASVYAVKVNAIPVPPTTGNSTASQKIIVGELSNITEAEQYVTIAKQKGIYLGETGKSGTVVYTFNDPALFILVAIKEDFRPGFARINILFASRKILTLNAPEVAEVNQTITIKVADMFTQGPVAKADVYAVKVSDIPEPKALSVLPFETNTAAGAAVTPLDINDIKSKGIFLGSTNDNGIVTAQFAASARYRLAAIKNDFLSGFDLISVVLSTKKALPMDGIR